MNETSLFRRCVFGAFAGLLIGLQPILAITVELHTVSSYSPRKGVTRVQPTPKPKQPETPPIGVKLDDTIELQVDYLADCIKAIKGPPDTDSPAMVEALVVTKSDAAVEVKAAADARAIANDKRTAAAKADDDAKNAADIATAAGAKASNAKAPETAQLAADAKSAADAAAVAATRAATAKREFEKAEKAAEALDAAATRATAEEVDDAFVRMAMPKLVLFINGFPMRELHVSDWLKDRPDWYPEMSAQEQTIPRHYLRFKLSRASSTMSKEDWDRVLKAPGDPWKPLLDVGVGYFSDNTADELPTWVRPGETEPELQVYLLRVPQDPWLVTGAIIVAAAFVAFLFCASLTGIVRDPTQPVGKDGLAPFSLGRCQMAFWFFLVAAAFIFLWLITGRGDIDTINGQVLTLIGISTGTAIGSAIIQANPPAKSDETKAKNQEGKPFPQQIDDTTKTLVEAQKRLAQAKESDLAAAKLQVEEAEKQLAKLKSDFSSYRWRHWYGFFLDLLSERDDQGHQVVVFYRFQIVVWTLVLGLIFFSDVATKLKMPAFDSSLLVLMGISSGAYLGFKLPPTK